MRSKLLTAKESRTWAIIFESGDEVMSGLKQFANDNGLTASSFQGIGALQSVTLGYFNWEKKEYSRIPVSEQVEVLTLAGDVATENGKPSVHAHLVIGKQDGTAHGGHLLEGYVRPTLEIILTETPAELQKKYDPESGLALIRP